VTAHLSPRGEHFLRRSPTLQCGQAQLHSIGLLEGTWTIARDDLTSFPEKPVFLHDWDECPPRILASASKKHMKPEHPSSG
jgi:hypothetical protein